MADHYITKRQTPISVVVMCACGWQHEEKRRQNAYARAGKIKAAVRKHLKEG